MAVQTSPPSILGAEGLLGPDDPGARDVAARAGVPRL